MGLIIRVLNNILSLFPRNLVHVLFIQFTPHALLVHVLFIQFTPHALLPCSTCRAGSMV